MYWLGEQVRVLARGGKNSRIQRQDGSITMVPNHTLSYNPQGDAQDLNNPIEVIARKIETVAAQFKTKWVGLLLKEGEYLFVRDGTGMGIGPGQYKEITTQGQADELYERLVKGGQFKTVRQGVIRSR